MKTTIWIMSILILALIIGLIVTNLPAAKIDRLRRRADRLERQIDKYIG